MEIKEVKATEHIEEVWNLLSSHRDELVTNKALMILKPDIERYKALEDGGALVTLALYDEESIVGMPVLLLKKLLTQAGYFN